jgi:hypothetical protein
MLGPGTPQELLHGLLQLGGCLVVLRMGEDGVLLGRTLEGGNIETCTVGCSCN